jgi:hypothetical protein
LTEFTVNVRLFEFKVMSMKLSIISETDQALMHSLLSCHEHAKSYINDVAIFSSTFEENLQDLREVLSHIKGADLTVMLLDLQLYGLPGVQARRRSLRQSRRRVWSFAGLWRNCDTTCLEVKFMVKSDHKPLQYLRLKP